MASSVILVIGDVENWVARGCSLPEGAGLVFEDFRTFTAESLGLHMPEVVLAPLTTPGFDALDVAEKLQNFNFTGAFRVLTPRLPDMAMVRRELLVLAPEIDCELIEVGPELLRDARPRPALKVV